MIIENLKQLGMTEDNAIKNVGLVFSTIQNYTQKPRFDEDVSVAQELQFTKTTTNTITLTSGDNWADFGFEVGDMIQVIKIILPKDNLVGFGVFDHNFRFHDKIKYTKRIYTIKAIANSVVTVDQTIFKDETSELTVFKIAIEDSDINPIFSMINFKLEERDSDLTLKSEHIANYSYTRETNRMFGGYPMHIIESYNYDKAMAGNLLKQLHRILLTFGVLL